MRTTSACTPAQTAQRPTGSAQQLDLSARSSPRLAKALASGGTGEAASFLRSASRLDTCCRPHTCRSTLAYGHASTC
eukprot:6167917-Alexandrium_andersonii.AAC.1